MRGRQAKALQVRSRGNTTCGALFPPPAAGPTELTKGREEEPMKRMPSVRTGPGHAGELASPHTLAKANGYEYHRYARAKPDPHGRRRRPSRRGHARDLLHPRRSLRRRRDSSDASVCCNALAEQAVAATVREQNKRRFDPAPSSRTSSRSDGVRDEGRNPRDSARGALAIRPLTMASSSRQRGEGQRAPTGAETANRSTLRLCSSC